MTKAMVRNSIKRHSIIYTHIYCTFDDRKKKNSFTYFLTGQRSHRKDSKNQELRYGTAEKPKNWRSNSPIKHNSTWNTKLEDLKHGSCEAPIAKVVGRRQRKDLDDDKK